ncbi:hypothetical protein Tco_1290491, partial [Tanacetum coccineum]
VEPEATRFSPYSPFVQQHAHQERQEDEQLYFLSHLFPTSLDCSLAEQSSKDYDQHYGWSEKVESSEQQVVKRKIDSVVRNWTGCCYTRVFVFTKVSTSPRVSSYLVKAYQIYLCCCKDWKLLFFDDAISFDSAVHRVHTISFDSAVHRVHAVSFDVAVLDAAATVSAACIIAAGYIVSAGICFCCYSILLLREDLSRNLE